MDQYIKKKFEEIIAQATCPKSFKCLEMDSRSFLKIQIDGPFLKCPCDSTGCGFLFIHNHDYCLCPVANFIFKMIEPEQINEFKELWNFKIILENVSPCEFWERISGAEGYCSKAEIEKKCGFQESFNRRSCEIWVKGIKGNYAGTLKIKSGSE